MEIKYSFIGSFLFFLLKITYFVQWTFSKLFWFLTIEPVLQLSKIIGIKNSDGRDGNESKVSSITLDFLKPTHKITWEYLRFMSEMNMKIAGTPSRFNYFEKLLKWNNEIPLIGFTENKTKYTFKLFGKYSDDGKTRGFDFAWLSTFNKMGYFQIAEKKLSGELKKRVVLVCVWINGEYIGKAFEIKGFTSPEDLTNKLIPGEIYCPPTIVIFLFEVIISVGFILSLAQLAKGGWTIIKSICDIVYKTHGK